jgi:hypothetical protein
VTVYPAPSALDLNSQLAGLEDSDYHGRIATERKFHQLAQAARAAADQLLAAEQQWRTEHTSCPPGTPAVEEPAQVVGDVPLYWRSPAIRTMG